MLIRKRLFLLSICFTLFCSTLLAQNTGSFKVYGSENMYYPVTFPDSGWAHNIASVLQLGRSAVYMDSLWRGSFIAQVRYHCYDWGSGADFINVDLRQHNLNAVTISNFVGGWVDASYTNSTTNIVIWLRGGGTIGTTYYFNCNYPITPTVYDGAQNALPYQIVGGSALSAISAPYPYVNQQGVSVGNMEYATGFNVVPYNGNNSVTINNDLNASYSWVVGGSAEPSGWIGKLNLNYLNYTGNHPRIRWETLALVSRTPFPC
jgi:hypothetical protein